MKIPELGTELAGRYLIERELGAGGMAIVFLAKDLQHDRHVALKVLRPELAAVIGADRFLAEIKTTAHLQHPHILALYDSGRVDGTIYYVMPFVDGESLRDRLRREKQLPVDTALRITREVAGALDYAHRQGVIHRDIKPENILLHEGQALVADFGIALAASRVGDRMTETGMSLGTPEYMSPEQAMGERTIDARSDVYALGCVLYEMLAGEPPFTGPTLQSIVAKVLTEETPEITAVRRSVPPHVAEAIRGALEKLPADRFESGRAFAEALDGGAMVRVPRRQTRRETDKAWPWKPLAIALGVAMVALAGALGWHIVHAPRSEAPPVTRFGLELPANVRLAVYSLAGANVAVSPDGRSIVLVAEGPSGSRQLYLRRIESLDFTALPGTEGASQPVFSPDGRWLGYLAGGRLMRVAMDGSAPQTVLPVSDIPGFAWASNDSIVLADGSGALSIVAASGGTPRRFAVLDSANGEVLQQYPVTLPDGEHIVYASWGAGGLESIRMGVVSLRTGKARRLNLPGTSPLGMVDDYLVYVTANSNVLAAKVDMRTLDVRSNPRPVGSGVMMGTGGVAKAAMSANGTLVHFGGARLSRLVLVSLDGSAQPLLDEERAYGYPRFSPDGRRIAITIESGSTSDIWVHDRLSGTTTRFSLGGSTNERPEWTPDGSRVLFRTDRSAFSAIWWRPIDQSERETPVLDGPGNAAYFEGVITPDGKSIVYQIDSTGADIAYQALEGDRAPRFITNTSAIETAPRISPDGKWIAFETDVSGARQVVVQPFPGPGPREQVSTDGGREPVWARDGRRLFYRGTHSVYVVEYSITSGFSVLSRRPLFEDTYLPAVSPHANYDVSPDGTKLLMLEGIDNPRMIVVENWATEVRRALGETSPSR
jgi:serine/threonine-protein kinase